MVILLVLIAFAALVLLIAVVLIVRGLLKYESDGRRLVFGGLAMIAVTFLVGATLVYWVVFQRGGLADTLRQRGAERDLGTLVELIESYKTQNGIHPASLQALQSSLPELDNFPLRDPTRLARAGTHRRYFYEPTDNCGYHLLSVGNDGIPFTDDDIVAIQPPMGRGELC